MGGHRVVRGKHLGPTQPCRLCRAVTWRVVLDRPPPCTVMAPPGGPVGRARTAGDSAEAQDKGGSLSRPAAKAPLEIVPGWGRETDTQGGWGCRVDPLPVTRLEEGVGLGEEACCGHRALHIKALPFLMGVTYFPLSEALYS